MSICKLLLLIILLPLVQVYAATTGNVVISGAIPAATAIVVTAQSGYNSIDLTSTATDLLVVKVRELNNTTAGYVVSLTSSNAGKLKNGSLGEKVYTAKYNNVAVTLSSTPITVTSQGAQTSVVNILKDFTISFTGSNVEDLMQGTYSDTITFTISAN